MNDDNIIRYVVWYYYHVDCNEAYESAKSWSAPEPVPGRQRISHVYARNEAQVFGRRLGAGLVEYRIF